MVEKTHKPLRIAHRLYTQYSTECKEIIESPHNRLNNDQEAIFSFGGMGVSLIVLYQSIMQLVSFTALSMMLGVIGFIISVQLLQYFSKVHTNSIS